MGWFWIIREGALIASAPLLGEKGFRGGESSRDVPLRVSVFPRGGPNRLAALLWLRCRFRSEARRWVPGWGVAQYPTEQDVHQLLCVLAESYWLLSCEES